MVDLQTHVAGNDHAGGSPEQLAHEEGHHEAHRHRLLDDGQDLTSGIRLRGSVLFASVAPCSAKNCAVSKPSPAVFPIANTVVVRSARANRPSTTPCSVSARRTSMRSGLTPPRSASFT